MILIREARIGDAAGIARVHIESWRSTYKSILPADLLASLSFERREQTWRQELARDGQPSLIYVAAQEDGEVVGFVSAGAGHEGIPDFEAEIYAIYLLQAAQGQGHGRRLMAAAASELLRRSFARIFLWVLKENAPACKFYEGLGGRLIDEKPIELGGQNLLEVAYGWKDIRVLLAEDPPGGATSPNRK
jgi:ribosomal protein S18 acetylase RimI-like enzyme